MNSHDAPPVEPAETHPDKLVDFWEWLVENRTHVSLVIIAALGVGMIMYVKKVRRVQNEELASQDFLVATNPDFIIEAVDTSLTASERLIRVANDNPGTAAAINARFLAASSLFDEGAYVKAEKAFDKFYTSNPSSPLTPAARFGKAASLDAASQAKGPIKSDQLFSTEEAIKGYKNVISLFPGSPEAMQSRVAVAKLYLAKAPPNTAEARKLLEEVTQAGPRFIPAFWESEARRLSGSLGPKDEVKEKPIKPKTEATQKNQKESEKAAKQPKKADSPPAKVEKQIK